MAQRRNQATQQRQRPAPQRSAQQPRAAAPAARSNRDALGELMAEDEGASIVKVDSDALASITKSEVGMQLDAAHRWPRSIKAFMEDAAYLVTMSKETAQSCIYTLPVRKGGDKPITGPSVRLAEMCATSWGNLHIGARIIDEAPRTVTAQALAWDLEKNMRLAIEVKRGIVTSDGFRFGDDMIRVTSMAAISIALRNAIFRIIPRALVNELYAQAESKATGQDDGTFEAERDEILAVFVNKWAVPLDRVLARLSITKVADITQELLAALIGIGQSLKRREITFEQAFPPVQAAPPPQSKATALDDMVSQAKKKSDPAPANDDSVLTAEKVHAALGDADEDWEPAERLVTIKGWSPAEQRIAYDWALAFVSTPENEPPPEQPEFTLLGRQMGDD
jgi:hypothetical protein